MKIPKPETRIEVFLMALLLGCFGLLAYAIMRG